MGGLDKGKTTTVILRRLLAAASQPVITERQADAPRRNVANLHPLLRPVKAAYLLQGIITNNSNMIARRSNE